MLTENNYIGVGLYTVPQTARILAVSKSVLRYWIGERSGVDSIVKRRFAADHLLTFAELMELHFVKLFREENVSFQTIRRAAREAAKKSGSDYPFTVKRFDTDGTRIFATLSSRATNREVVEELRHGQFVFKSLIRPFFKKMDYSSAAEIERFWPLKKSGRVVLDPARRFGQPIDSMTGIPTATIFDAINAGDGQDVPTVAKWFDIPPEAVKAAIRFERSLAS